MENPKQEIQDVVRALIQTPTLQRQAETIQKFFAPDAKFYHFYIDTGSEPQDGAEDLTSIYQFAEVFLNYRRVEYLHVAYDPEANSVTLLMNIYTRPFFRLFMEASFSLLVLLELEDFQAQQEVNGEVQTKTLKRIKIQRDYFQRVPSLLFIPILGDIYASHTLRFIIGRMQALGFRTARNIVRMLVPEHISRGLLGVWQDAEAEATNVQQRLSNGLKKEN